MLGVGELFAHVCERTTITLFECVFASVWNRVLSAREHSVIVVIMILGLSQLVILMEFGLGIVAN